MTTSLLLTSKTTAYQFGKTFVLPIPKEVVEAANILDGQEMEINVNPEGKIIISHKDEDVPRTN